MTISHAVLTIFMPVVGMTTLAAYTHKLGPWYVMKAIAAFIWALAFAIPSSIRRFRRIFSLHYKQTMKVS